MRVLDKKLNLMNALAHDPAHDIVKQLHGSDLTFEFKMLAQVYLTYLLVCGQLLGGTCF